MSRRPNVVLIITDQHRLDHTGFGGNPVVQTPHLDALAARATSFTEAFAANPICMPNRATILTGRMPPSPQYPIPSTQYLSILIPVHHGGV